MQHVIVDVINGIILFSIGTWYQRRLDRRKPREAEGTVLPYSWSCAHTHCAFKIRTSEEELLHKLVATHVTGHASYLPRRATNG